MFWVKEDFSWKNLGIAILCALVTSGVFWVVRDIYHGEWRQIPSKVVGKRYIPDRSHWEMYMWCHQVGTGKMSHMECTPRQRYVNIPPEYHVYVREPDGRVGNYNDFSAFNALQPSSRVIIKARYGQSGWRYTDFIDLKATFHPAGIK